MSFILDALKKSETDRQQQSAAEFAGVPTSNDRPGIPRWLWLLGALLAINLVVLLGLLLRPAATPANIQSTTVDEIEDTTIDPPSFAQQVAAAKQSVSAPQEAAEPSAAESQPTPEVTPGVVYSATPSNASALPTIHEARANGTVDLPELHLDIHVFSDVPEDRFVFINMSKHREKSALSEGPVVEEITPEGVVLEYRGTSFLLPRE
ncbi:MAG: general secretion pathway protein GspB [Gammaproteobacteria bacterium]|nr:general secretion pathway protein GspB [Gammaproteobacteria bacterium]MBU2678471.1 general secretion pathway protein GspB [Gammaproteobacteria bacterium]NNC57303.1 general secretion pathway protein GspB [Woeseiaceae bacterium]NNL52206.1 general secretion pathway protein GspB [Woeseiaceae bacterium]